MGAGTFQLAANTDDGRDPVTSGSWDNNDNSYIVGRATSSDNYSLWLRFAGVNIPQGATIVSAHLNLKLSTSVLPLTIQFAAVDEDDPAAPTSLDDSDADLAALTTARVNATLDSITGEAFNEMAGISTILQEIVDRAGFAGDHVLFYIKPTVVYNKYITVYTRDLSTAVAATLDVEWTDPSTFIPSITIM